MEDGEKGTDGEMEPLASGSKEPELPVYYGTIYHSGKQASDLEAWLADNCAGGWLVIPYTGKAASKGNVEEDPKGEGSGNTLKVMFHSPADLNRFMKAHVSGENSGPGED